MILGYMWTGLPKAQVATLESRELRTLLKTISWFPKDGKRVEVRLS